MKPSGLWLMPLLFCVCALPAKEAPTEKICAPQASSGGPGTALVFQNNHYNRKSGQTQCIDITDAAAGAFFITSTSDVHTNDAPAGYPSVFAGCHWGLCSDPEEGGLPIQVSDIATARSRWAVQPINPGIWDISYDIWFNQSASIRGQPDGTEIMIWLDHKGPIQPASETGSPSYRGEADGITFDIWVARKGKAQGGFNKSWNIISFVATTPQRDVKLNLLPFFSFAYSKDLLAQSWWLVDVEAGFEPWKGGSGLASKAFSFKVSRFSQQPGPGS